MRLIVSRLFDFDFLRFESLSLPSFAFVVSGDLEHSGAGLPITK
jgi:hypothetical protein